jgi:hypothetical protein
MRRCGPMPAPAFYSFDECEMKLNLIILLVAAYRIILLVAAYRSRRL